MDVVVCVKQIPEEHDRIEFDGTSLFVRRDGKLVMDETDSYGVEIALRLVEQAGEGTVTVVSVAPHDTVSGLHTALAMGADRAVLVSDEQLGGADALATAEVLAAVIRQIAPSLAIAGTESTDGYTGTMPIQLAELLGWPALAFSSSLELIGTELRSRRATDDGLVELSCPFPAIATVTSGSVEPRYPSFRGIMQARTKPIEILRLSDLALDPNELGPREEVVSIVPAPQRAGGEVIVDDGNAEERLIALLAEWKVV
ncbi:MAG: electron transfer flavoprotein subunit beta/FixA family protein [Acidimicrobiales bacterium]